MGVSINGGTPKSSIYRLDGFSLIDHPLWGSPIYGNPHLFLPEDEDRDTVQEQIQEIQAGNSNMDVLRGPTACSMVDGLSNFHRKNAND